MSKEKCLDIFPSVCVCVAAHTRGGHWVSYSVTLHLILWTEGLLMKLELEQRPESPSDPPSTLSPPPVWGYRSCRNNRTQLFIF